MEEKVKKEYDKKIDKTVENKNETVGSIVDKKESNKRIERGQKPSLRKNPRKFVRRERTKNEFEQKILNIRRVTRVVSGGRRFSFSVAIVIGDKRGSVGVGSGKATDTSLAIEKAIRDAKKNMIKVVLNKDMSIATEIRAKYSSSIIEMRPTHGRGVSAGSAVHDVIEMAGIKDVTAKILSRSKNKLNIAQATIKALKTIK
ncbi:30S ribosomal protein S5 [Patescibacteria group bacterium]|nr:30S ribosomal protein S5 [Patescibacteria group bacterium]MBU4057360.1 30S ribosomal protein S5 [Patescibacteria group bacterium]MBU4115745.1 30S ribosomal protein S5 [Patescibacteria group bacterium]